MNSNVTKLPDGSAFFTATVLSPEEVMALPLKERPICNRISSEMYYAVFESIGAASMCWNPKPSAEVFNSDLAAGIASKLCFTIADEVEKVKAIATSKIEGKTLREYLEQQFPATIGHIPLQMFCEQLESLVK